MTVSGVSFTLGLKFGLCGIGLKSAFRPISAWRPTMAKVAI